MGRNKMDLQDKPTIQKADMLDAELLSTVSHELRNPLASIKGYTFTLLRHEQHISRKERHEFLAAIDQASNRLEVVIDRLLQLSELETGKVDLMLSRVHLPHLVQEAIIGREQYGQNQPSVGNSSRFQLRVEGTWYNLQAEEQVLLLDRMRMREVLDHLLENACLYSAEDEKVEITIRPMTSFTTAGETDLSLPDNHRSGPLQRQMVEIVVQDHGIGIPQEHLKSIFQRFHRVDTSLTREVNGLGLGLAICKHIIELHHGFIWAESELGSGSTFHVLLPIQTKAEQTAYISK